MPVQISRTFKATVTSRGRDSPVGIAIRYVVAGPEIESRWARDFAHPSRLPWGPPNLLYNGYRISFPEVKKPGRGVDYPPPI